MSKHFVLPCVLAVACLTGSAQSAAQWGNPATGCREPGALRSAPACDWGLSCVAPCRPIAISPTGFQCPAPCPGAAMPGCFCPQSGQACGIVIPWGPRAGVFPSPWHSQPIPCQPKCCQPSCCQPLLNDNPCATTSTTLSFPQQFYTMEQFGAIPVPDALSDCIIFCRANNSGDKTCQNHCYLDCNYMFGGGPDPGRRIAGCSYWAPAPQAGQ